MNSMKARHISLEFMCGEVPSTSKNFFKPEVLGFYGVFEKMSARSREISSVSQILPLFYFLFYVFNFLCFLLQNHFKRVSAELGDYDSHLTD